jgi:hypothetical protein
MFFLEADQENVFEASEKKKTKTFFGLGFNHIPPPTHLSSREKLTILRPDTRPGGGNSF